MNNSRRWKYTVVIPTNTTRIYLHILKKHPLNSWLSRYIKKKFFMKKIQKCAQTFHCYFYHQIWIIFVLNKKWKFLLFFARKIKRIRKFQIQSIFLSQFLTNKGYNKLMRVSVQQDEKIKEICISSIIFILSKDFFFL